MIVENVREGKRTGKRSRGENFSPPLKIEGFSRSRHLKHLANTDG
jgi:hypothetical protein